MRRPALVNVIEENPHRGLVFQVVNQRRPERRYLLLVNEGSNLRARKRHGLIHSSHKPARNPIDDFNEALRKISLADLLIQRVEGEKSLVWLEEPMIT